MARRNIPALIIVVAIFAFSICSLVFSLPPSYRQGMSFGLDLKGGTHLVYKADLSNVNPGDEAEVMDGVVAVIVNRVNPLGVTEPIIEKQGVDRIVVQLPGINFSDVQKERIGRTAILEFGELAADDEEAKWVVKVDNEEVRWKPATAIINGQEKVLTSSYFNENTYITVGQQGGVVLNFEWNEEGSKLSEQITGRLIGQRLGIFEGEEPLRGDDGAPIAPTVKAKITYKGIIEGLSQKEANDLSAQLNAGRLPVSLEPIFEETITPALGADFVDLSYRAGIIGIILVMVFMIIYYRLPGLLASIALVFYAALVLALFKLIPVTLTLAGIGGFILSIGMAVDANVLIFERMKEELRAGRTLGAAIEAGFNRAWSAIRDSNITTFIVCFVLIAVGNSIAAGAPVKGFGVTLLIGVAISMFTAIVVTRTFLRLFVGSRLAGKINLFRPHSGKE